MTEREAYLCRRAQEAALAASRPFVRVACDLISVSSHTLIVEADRVEVRYPPDVEARLAWLRGMARSEAQRAFDSVLRGWDGVFPFSGSRP